MQNERAKLLASPRTTLGKKVRFLRREGWTPANVFGHGIVSMAVQLRTRDVEHVLTHIPRSALLTLAVEGASEETVVVRGIDRKATTDELRHVDFYRVSMTELLRSAIPILFTGESDAAKLHDATILHAVDMIHIECLPADLPTRIEVDLTRLAEIDDAIHVRDLTIPPGVTVLDDPEDLVVKALAPALPEVEKVEEAEEVEGPAAESTEEAAAEAAETSQTS